MQELPNINLADYHYNLAEERIAKFPLKRRDEAKLLIYKEGEISHSQFFNLHKQISEEHLLVFNNTKVIPARLYFQKVTGAIIEIFLLNPIEPKEVNQVMQIQKQCIWKCMIGNQKRWKNKEKLEQIVSIAGQNLRLSVSALENQEILFEWEGNFSWSEILQASGEIPLPPYLKRETTEADKEQYQTVYSKIKGAVASPTAGLHFTEKVLKDLDKKGVQQDFVTLHVSAGTFQPVKTDNAVEHIMHSEQIIITKQNIENLLLKLPNIIAVGTTSVRVLESLYFFGLRLNQENWQEKEIPFQITKLFPYQNEHILTPQESLQLVLEYMDTHNLSKIIGETEIYIFPSYKFKVCKGLITNFHLPDTTLILLIAAFVGKDWRKIYQSALDNDYRFLSYGDSSLLLPKINK